MSAVTSVPSSKLDKKSPKENAKEKKGIVQHARFLGSLFSDTGDRFSENDGYRLVAAFSYYATFSIFPLLLLAITIVGFIVGDSAPARNRLLATIALPGSPVRDVLSQALAAMQDNRGMRGIAAAIGLATLFFSASGAFVELDASLFNRIWCVPLRKSKGILGTIRVYLIERASGLAIVLAFGLTLLISLASSSVLSHITERATSEVTFASDLPIWPGFVKTAELSLSILLLTTVFALAFHFIPRVHPRTPIRAVAPGAFLTTVLLVALKEVFAIYLSKLTSYSAYGVAGGMLALATWIYLSSMIIFFGAQMTRIHAEKTGAIEKCDLDAQREAGRDAT